MVQRVLALQILLKYGRKPCSVKIGRERNLLVVSAVHADGLTKVRILISNGCGIIVVPEELVPEYKKLLIAFYETNDNTDVFGFLFDNCLLKLR